MKFVPRTADCGSCERKEGQAYKTDCRECRTAVNTLWKLKNPGKAAEMQRAYNLRTRMACIEAYGGKCVCCGESQWEFLSIEHIGGTGAAERRNGYHGGVALYQRLRRAGWPKDGYELRCFNCNLAKGFFGYCPHEKQPYDSVHPSV